MILKDISVLELRIIKMHKEIDLVSVENTRCARMEAREFLRKKEEVFG